MSSKTDNKNIAVTNRKAFHNYVILKKYEAGIVLLGSEVKSIRSHKASLKDGYVYLIKGELFITGLHIAAYSNSGSFIPDPDRDRKLLMHKKEILKISSEIKKTGLTIIPLRLYFRNGRVKIEIAIAKGKKLYDKREVLKKEDQNRDALRQIKGVIGLDRNGGR